jgi:hypothetical protein
MTDRDATADLLPEAAGERIRLLAIRESLRTARHAAPTPAVSYALRGAEQQVFLALSYLGFTDELTPDESH